MTVILAQKTLHCVKWGPSPGGKKAGSVDAFDGLRHTDNEYPSPSRDPVNPSRCPSRHHRQDPARLATQRLHPGRGEAMKPTLTALLISEVAFQLSEAVHEGETKAAQRLASVANVMRYEADPPGRERLAEALADFGFPVSLLELEGDSNGLSI